MSLSVFIAVAVGAAVTSAAVGSAVGTEVASGVAVGAAVAVGVAVASGVVVGVCVTVTSCVAVGITVGVTVGFAAVVGTGVAVTVTVGPVSSSPQMIASLVKAGVNVFRLNFSHGTQAEHLNQIKAIRAQAKKDKTHYTILADMQGPKLRVGHFSKGVDFQHNLAFQQNLGHFRL